MYNKSYTYKINDTYIFVNFVFGMDSDRVACRIECDSCDEWYNTTPMMDFIETFVSYDMNRYDASSFSVFNWVIALRLFDLGVI